MMGEKLVAHRARLVVSMEGPVIADGMVTVRGNEIVAVGGWDGAAAAGARVVDHGEVALVPGLINAHCHLDYTVMRGAILERRSFSGWVRRINELKRTLTDDDYLASIADGFRELQRWGTTTVLNIEAFPELMVRMPVPPTRTWWFYELLDVRNRIDTEDVVAGALSFFEERPSWHGGFGLSPHAPYSTSVGLYRLARACAEGYGMPFMTHLAESEEEMAMFRDGGGPMFDFLASIGRDMSDVGGRSPIELLLEAEVLPRGAMLTHMNFVTAADEVALARRAGEFAIVHCPNCHEYFGRAAFPYAVFQRLGFDVSLGTDSCASNWGLNLFSEMRTFRRNFPGVAAEEVLRMVTRNPARALRMGDRLGVLRAGALADFVTVPFAGGAEDVFEAVVENDRPPLVVVCSGREVGAGYNA